MSWLEHGPGTGPPEPDRPPTHGPWIVCGYGRFGREVASDLSAEGLDVTVIDLHPHADAGSTIVVGDASEAEVMTRAGVHEAAGFVAGTDNDTTNLSLIAAARKVNPELYVAVRQNRPVNAPLFAAMQPDWLLVPAEMVAREIYAQLSTPLLWRFLQDMPGRGDEWAAGVVDRLRGHCGEHLGSVWKVTLTSLDAPALASWLGTGDARLGDLLKAPHDRSRSLGAVPLLLMRDGEAILGPEDDTTLAAGDQILFAGRPSARRFLLDTMTNHAISEYVLHGRSVPAGWLWQRMTGRIPHARS
jgi:Trk K+ transport system NAD-binding subunit